MTRSRIRPLPLALGLAWGVSACAGGSDTVTSAGERLHAHHLAQIDHAHSSAIGAPVHVAIIDTSAGVDGTADADSHGDIMASIVRDIACDPSSSCAVSVSRWKGVPRQGDLAAAVGRVLEAHPPARERLVINLSVGWSPAENDPNSGAREALRRASCAGALVIAAAGNVADGLAEGLALPAAWGAERLSADTCGDAAGYPRDVVAGGALLYPVSGLDGRGAPLGVSPAHGRTQLAFHAMAVTAPTRARDGRSSFTAPASGTSSAAATASGVAAAVWGEHPTWSPRDLMRHLVDSATELPGSPADACYFGVGDGVGCGNSRRISMSRALGLPSAARGTVEPYVDLAGQLDWGRAFVARRTDSVLGADVHPQPGNPGCDGCSLSASTDTFTVNVDAVFWAAARPDSVILNLVWTDGSSHAYSFALTGQQLSRVVPGTPAWTSATAQFTATLPSPYTTNPEQVTYVQ